MARWFKFVALMLMLVMGALPLLASASPTCHPLAGPVSAAPAAHRCCPSMSAMAEAAVPSRALEGNDPMPCCRVAPAKPVRTADLQMPAATAELALQPADRTLNVVPVTTHARCDNHLPLPDFAHTQSQLCTFLI